eukprot:gnl/Chilomastix_cuspidata/2636.p1 GENE.gnl/Chilomastix_cuspidata/2636~~gnl/Chilomastix_cuspidata/2636.p1  ORF type:complete len:162 (-),score=44.32 gnl/Chilomastix_cuspidata/2636:109-594(-)
MSAPAPPPETRSVLLVSSDDKCYEVPAEVVKKSSPVLRDLLATQTEPIPVKLEIHSNFLPYVIEWIKFMYDFSGIDESESKAAQFRQSFWDLESEDILLGCILAADCLGIRDMADSGCAVVAGKIKGKTPEQIRALFRIESGFTPEEEESNKRTFAWLVTE